MIKRLSGLRRATRRDRLKKLIADKNAARREAVLTSPISSEQPRNRRTREVPAGFSANDNGIERQP